MKAWTWLGTVRGFRLVQVVVLVTVVMVGYLVYAQQRTVDCNRAYNEASAKVSRIRSAAADARAEALAEAIRKSTTGNPAEYRAAAEAYLAQYEAEKKAREEHPLTDPPSTFCG